VHRSRVVILVGVAVAALALFLPQARFPVLGPVDGFDGDAWPVMIPLGLLAVAALVGDRAEGYRWPLAVLALLLACGALVFAIAKVVDAVAAVRPLDGAGVGAGAWGVTVGAALAVAGTLLSFSRRLG
jgi:hypothetical protein